MERSGLWEDQMLLNRRRVVQSAAALGTLTATGSAWAGPKPLAFLATGDWGMDGDHFQRQVGHTMGPWAARIDSQFVVAVGDNFYDAGVQSIADPHWKNSFEDIYAAPSLQTPWYAILGNHDYGGAPEAQVEYSAHSKRWKMPARYYKQSMTAPDGAAVDLFFLDTAPMLEGYRNRKEDTLFRQNIRAQDVAAQLRWLESSLSASKASWKIVFGHHPVHSGGVHGDTRELIADVKPILRRYGVQAYVCGHDHDLQHIDRDGVTYIATGAGATTRKVVATNGTQFCSDLPGFTAYRLTAERLDVDFVSVSGQVIHSAKVSRNA
jgi:acid phosphatase